MNGQSLTSRPSGRSVAGRQPRLRRCVRLLPGNSSPRRHHAVRYGRLVVVDLDAPVSAAAADASVIDNDEDDRGTGISLRLVFHVSNVI